MRVTLLTTLLVAGATAPVFAQTASNDPLFRDLRWRNIGPANMSGRVTFIEAVESNPAIVYLGAASGGVWKSTNAGTTWEPVFTNYGTANIGAIAVFQPNPDIVWVGTGEPCVRNSAAWGDGVYRSTDGGRTFTNVGLRESHHIDDIVTHPTNPDIAYVAAQGHLWGYNSERGIFRTRDGGRTWEQLTNGLPNDGRTGGSAIAMDPANPNVLYAGMWERIRYPHKFVSGGANGGIYKSTDGGNTWRKLTSGLPPGETGKIGISISRKNPRVLIALVEHGFQPRQADAEYADMTKLGTGIYRSEDGGESWQYISRYNNRPFYFTHIWIDPGNDQRVFLLAGSAQVSEDGGRTFTRSLQGIEGDFHALWIDPNNSNRFYVGNDKGAYLTHDGGLRFIMFDNMDIGQFYAITADNRDPYWVYGGLQDSGNWGGPSNSRDFNGILNDHWFKFHSGDGFHATADPNDWRTIYTESQNGGIRRLDAVFRQQGKTITPRPATIHNLAEAVPGFTGNSLSRDRFRFNWSTPLVLSPHDSKTLLYGGNYLFRSTDRGETWSIISRDLSTGDTALANPASGGLTSDATGAETHATAITISESPLVPGVLWVGTDDGNVQLTRDGGKTWTNVRTNVPTRTPTGAANRTAVAGVPERAWVSRVEASHFDPATAYVSFDNHRKDDFRPYVYKTTDYGRTWTNITANLPQKEPVYVVKEDLKNPRLLFAGTEFAAYASVDGGRTWQRIMNGMPTVAVHDLVIHPRDGDLIAGTHGRSIWILDDITPLQQLTEPVQAAAVHLFNNRVATKWRGVSRGATRGHMLFMGRNPLTIQQRPPANSPTELANTGAVNFWLKDDPAEPVTLEILAPDGPQKFTAQIPAQRGINRYSWNLSFAPAVTLQVAGGGRRGGGARGGGAGGAGARAGGGGGGGGGGDEEGMGARGGGGGGGGAGQVAAGTYLVRLTVAGKTYSGSITVREDPESRAGN